jgi:hypothetical protein
MKRWQRVALGAAGIVLAGAQLVRPERTNPTIDPGRALNARHSVPESVAEILDRACRDCHSNDTRWPWYSHVAPVSWYVIDHVNHGRSHFNYSDWARYSPEEGRTLLKNSCDLARESEMPLASYALMHRSAKLSRADVETLCGWAAAAVRPE